MKRFLLLAFLFLPIMVQAQTPIITSATPVVNQGATFNFTANAAGTWSCAGTNSSGGAAACAGSIVAGTGVYTAPAVVNSQQSSQGCQLLPNNHILNTRIDNMPVHSSSATWIGTMSGSLGVDPSIPLNYVTNATANTNMVFQYSPDYNGNFKLPSYPNGNLQSGWESAYFDTDHHLFAVNSDTCNFEEIYDLYPIGANVPAPLTNSVAGAQYLSSTYTLPLIPGHGSGADAAGMNMQAMMLHLPEMENALAASGTIKHALRGTMSVFLVSFTNFLWPAAAADASGGGVVPFGARFRLKSAYDISSFSPIAQIMLTAMKQYGIIIDDGTIGPGIDVTVDYAKWPKAYTDAFTEIVTKPVAITNFDIVDESGLMVNSLSGLTTENREIVTFTRASDSATASVDVALVGVTIGLPNDTMTIQAGTPAQQFTAYVNGTSNATVTWTMSPTVGTLTAGGLYTPPATVASETSTTVTATSAANTNVVTTMTVTILPTGPIRIIMATATDFAAVGWAWPFVDSSGNTWQSQTGDNGGRIDVLGSLTVPPWADTNTVRLYSHTYFTSAVTNDMRFDIYVPNGNYNVTGKFAETFYSSAGQSSIDLETQGTIRNSNVNLYTAAGGKYKPVDFTLPATVTNGKLSFVIRYITGAWTGLNALEIDFLPAAGPQGSIRNHLP